MARAMLVDVVSSVCRVARVVLAKLMVRPVASAKVFRMFLRVEGAAEEAAATMSVSSAYWRTVGGRWEKMGWWSVESEFWRMSC